MKKKTKLFIIMAMGLFILFGHGCQKDSVPKIEIVAKVGDFTLTRNELLKWLPPNLPEENKEIVARQFVDRWVQNTALFIAAQEQGYALTNYEQWAITNLQKEMLAQKYLDSKMPAQIPLTDEEISRYYDEHKEEFKREEDEVHIIQLFLENLDRAISSEIRSSNSLLEVIKKNYLDSQVNRLLEKNGDLGYVPVSSLRKEIMWYIRNGKTGRIYGPIKIESGNYYFQMMDKQPAGSYRSRDLVLDKIKTRLLNVNRKKIELEVASSVVDKLNPEIYPEHIK
jgi:peptidyl-prolyl cis-trans isomerase C